MRGTSARVRGRRQYAVGLILLDGTWVPDDWSDAPLEGVVSQVIARCATRARAEGWVYGYNSAMLEHLGLQQFAGVGLWAVVLGCNLPIAPGDVCIRECSRLRIRARIPV